MLIYGIKTVNLKSIDSETLWCPNCSKRGSLTISISRKHIHLFWIPMFPLKKKGIAKCHNCKDVLKIKQMPDDVKREFAELRTSIKGPIWQFSGLGLTLIILFTFRYDYIADKKQEAIYLSSPQIGDVYHYHYHYHYHSQERTYSTLKIISVTDDSIWVVPNKYETNKMSKVYKISKVENYSDSAFGISKAGLKERYKSKNILILKDNKYPVL